MVGNLGADGAATWALPMDVRMVGVRLSVDTFLSHCRSSDPEPEDGMMMDNWVLASDTSFAQMNAYP